MKKTLLLATLSLVILSSYAGNWIKINAETPQPAKVTLVSSNIETSVIHFSLGGFKLRRVQTQQGYACTIELEGTTPLLSKGNPDLPRMTASLIIPNQAKMSTEVVSASYKDFKNVIIAPSKGNLTRDIDPSSVAYSYNSSYSVNAFYPSEIAGLNEPYIMRDYRGQALYAYPFQYNPVTKTLRVYYDITIKMKSVGKSKENILPDNKAVTTIDREFKQVYNRHFLNFASSKYTPVEEQGSMLIISYAAFIPAIQPFMNWKIAEGIETHLVDVASIGNANAIKTYVNNYAAEHGLTYLVLVGDHQQVPCYQENSGYSDNSYSYVVGTDHYPDLFVGRFSGENVEHITTQVDKLLKYEINPNISTEWMPKAIGIGSDQGPGDDNEYDYQHIRGLLTELDGFTYASYSELFDGSQGGFDAAGNPTPTQVGGAINDGASCIVYCGHGSQTSWGTSGFSNSNVNALTNSGLLPYIFSVACVNGDFTNGTCFAEAWLRAKNGENLTGAVATLMSTINQSWNPPMEGEDAMISILTESDSNNIKRTFGGISMNGCMKMNDTYSGNAGTDMTDTWTVFGDPSMMVRTATAQILTATHNPTVFVGQNQFQINCPVEGALACITMNNEILGTGNIIGGTVTINFTSPITVIDTLHLVITAFNYIPYITNIQIITASGPYMALNAWQVNDPTGNNNNLPDYGESINLDMTLHNLGIDSANFVNALISTSDTYVTVTDNTQNYGTVLPSGSNTQSNAYAMHIAAFIPDQHQVPFMVSITDNASHNWNSNFSMTINAPSLQAGLLTINDATGGNGNGQLDPGETVTITIPTPNIGHADATNTVGTITSTNSWISITSGTCNMNTIITTGSGTATFTFSVSPLATIGETVDISYIAASGPYTVQKNYYIPVGIISEDFETGNFNNYAWQFNGNVPWVITNVNTYQGIYCARSGIIGNDQHTDMLVNFDVLSDDSISFYRRVSSEETYDFLQFFIDSEKKDEWSGSIAWSRVVYPVSAGNHTFIWTYIKDYMETGGSDAAWVDYIEFPPVSVATGIDNPVYASSGLNVYPNPASDRITIDFLLTTSGNVSISLYDVIGNKVVDVLPASNKTLGVYSTNLNTADLASGVYFIRMENNEKNSIKKVVISK